MEYLTRPLGATTSELEAVEARYGVVLPLDLRRFWAESAGPILWFGHKELQFLSIPEVLNDTYGLSKWMPGALPICMDGGGNICVARIEEGHVAGYFAAACGDLGWESAAAISKDLVGLLRDDESPEARIQKKSNLR